MTGRTDIYLYPGLRQPFKNFFREFNWNCNPTSSASPASLCSCGCTQEKAIVLFNVSGAMFSTDEAEELWKKTRKQLGNEIGNSLHALRALNGCSSSWEEIGGYSDTTGSPQPTSPIGHSGKPMVCCCK